MDDIVRVDCAEFERLNDNMAFDVGHLPMEFDLEFTGVAICQGTPEVIRRPENEIIYRLPDDALIVRPRDATNLDRDPSWISLERS
jgi:hypothetical protein